MSEKSIVFLVDDDKAIREAISASLQARGLVVDCYQSAEEFVDSYEDQPGCLILDICLEGIDGIALQKRLKERQTEIPIIFISGHGDIPMAAEAFRTGAIDFLEKPYDPNILIARIDEALAKDARIRQERAKKDQLMTRLGRLTKREKEVMVLLVSGASNRSNKDIAKQLNISHRTVDDHRTRIMLKMQSRSLPELMTMAKICGVYQD